MCHENEKYCKIWRRIDLSIQNWHEEFDEFWPWALKNLKNLDFNELFLTKVYNVWAKKMYRGVMFDCTEDWCKIWRQTELYFLKIGSFFGCFSKVENVWGWNLQGSYVSWEWRMMQNLKRNWLVNSKWTWVIWWILRRALENLENVHFNGLLLTIVYNVWVKKIKRRYV